MMLINPKLTSYTIQLLQKATTDTKQEQELCHQSSARHARTRPHNISVFNKGVCVALANENHSFFSVI